MIVAIDKVIVKDRIRKDFGDIQELADDIKQNGLINPPVVNKEYELLAGERRLKACKSLGWTQIEVRMMDTRDAEHELNVEISENDVRKGFTKSERVDYMKRLLRIEEAKGKQRMSDGGKGGHKSDNLRADEETAKQFEISRDTMRKEMQIVDNKDLLDSSDFADWDEGKLSTNKAFQKIKERQKQIEAENDKLRKALSESESKNAIVKHELENAKRQVEVKEVPVVPDDYEEIKEKAKRYESAAESEKRIAIEYNKVLHENNEQRNRIKQLEEREGINTLRDRVNKEAEYFTLETYRFIRESGGHVWIFDQMKELPEEKFENFKKAIYALDAFAKQMIENIGGYGIE